MLADAANTTRDADTEPWEIRCAPGPVLTTAIHAGHAMRAGLVPYLALGPDQRLREEDPFTDFWMPLGDTTIRVNRSRFEVDLNRPVEDAVYLEPEDSWGLEVWRELPTEMEVERSRRLHRQFYVAVERLLARLVDRWGAVLVLDLHSYNHRRTGPRAEPADPAANPDIDLGVTTAEHRRFGPLLDCFRGCLSEPDATGARLDVRENVRYPTGGYFPEWIFRRWGDRVCTITVEVKKFFMDEWTGTVDLRAGQRVRDLLARAVGAARRELPRC